jgi:hypothetical protein
MKTTLTVSIFLMLITGIGCKKPIDALIPKSPEDCRIVKTIYKTTILGRESGPKYDLETVILSDGKTATISRVLESFYKYDKQERIVEQTDKWPNGDYRLTKFNYSTTYVVRQTELLASLISSTVRITKDTLYLYPNGFKTGSSGTGPPDLRYNRDGQYTGGGSSMNRPAGDSCRYENGNCVEKIEGPLWQYINGRWLPTDYLLITYQYDLSRPNLRPFLQFMGKPSRNLPISEIWAKRASSEFPNVNVYRKDYLYTFDQYGRVTRRIAHGRPLYLWFIEDDYNGVGVTDYVYECP